MMILKKGFTSESTQLRNSNTILTQQKTSTLLLNPMMRSFLNFTTMTHQVQHAYFIPTSMKKVIF